MRARCVTIVIAAVLGGACAVQTQPPPRIEIPSGWRTQLMDERATRRSTNADSLARSAWWLVFNDPELTVLIESARLQNVDVAAAEQRVIQARAVLESVRGQQQPTLDLAVSSQHSGSTMIGGAAIVSPARTSSSATLSASYSLDLWSAARARTFGARSQLEALEASRAVTVWRLSAAVAQLYYERCALVESVVLARESLDIAQRTYERIEARYDAGLISGLDLALAKTAVASEREHLSFVQLALDQAHNAMALLLGRAPAELNGSEELAAARAPALLERSLPPLPSALPAQVLARRPDIHVQEAQLRAADANITVARASLFPQISVGAGTAMTSGAGELALTIGSSLVQSIFDGGQRRASVRIAEAQYAALLQDYRAAILSALVEVEDALAQVRALSAREAAGRAVLEAATQAYELSKLRYESGLVDALTLLSTQTSFLRARDALIQTRSSHLQALTALYAGIYRTEESPQP